MRYDTSIFAFTSKIKISFRRVSAWKGTGMPATQGGDGGQKRVRYDIQHSLFTSPDFWKPSKTLGGAQEGKPDTKNWRLETETESAIAWHGGLGMINAVIELQQSVQHKEPDEAGCGLILRATGIFIFRFRFSVLLSIFLSFSAYVLRTAFHIKSKTFFVVPVVYIQHDADGINYTACCYLLLCTAVCSLQLQYTWYY